MATSPGRRALERPGASPSRSSRRWAAIGFCALAVVLACLVFWPTGPLDNLRLPNGALGDPDEMTWFLAWTPWAILHGHNPFLTHAIDLPGGVNLASNTSVPLLGLLGSPISEGIGPIAAMNVLLRLGLATSAISAFFVFRRYTTGQLGAAVGGLVFGFGPALTSHLQGFGHLNLVVVGLLPLLFACADELLVRQRWRPARTGTCLGLLAGAQYLISAELLADAVLLGLLAALAAAFSHRHDLGPRVAYALRAGLVALGCFVVVAGYPIALLIAGPGHLQGPVQAASHLQQFKADLLEALVPDAHQWLDPASFAALSRRVLAPVTRAGGAAELGGYLGLPLVLLAIGSAIRWRRSGVIQLASLLGVAAFIASLGSRLQVDGRDTPVPLPEGLLAKLPLLDSTVPARFAVFVAMCAALVVAFGIDKSLVALRARRLVAPAAGVLALSACSLVALAPALPVSKESPALSGPLAGAVAGLIPPHSTVLAYPYPEPPFAEAMLWQASDHFAFALLGGYANVKGPGGKGLLYPPLVAPVGIQELLGYAESGRRTHYPLPTPGATSPAALCQFLTEQHADVVAADDVGPGWPSVDQLFVATLGMPSRSAAGLHVWTDVRRACKAP